MKLLIVVALGVAAGTLVAALGAAYGAGGSGQIREKIVLPLDGTSLSPNLEVHPGSLVTLTIVNRTGMAHTFFVPKLHINEPIAVGTRAHPSTVTVTFLVPKAGTFEWHCVMPCGDHMGGLIYAPAGLNFNPGWTVAA
jgi:plastocyanin